MNILQINTADNKGGAAKVAFRLKHELENIGHTSRMFVGRKYSQDSNIFIIKQPSYISRVISRLVDRNIEETVKRKLSYWLANDIDLFRSSYHILNTPQFREADIIHCHNLHSNYFKLDTLTHIAQHKPIVWTFHDMWPITPHCAHAFDAPVKDGFFQSPDLSIYPPIAWHNEQYLTWRKKNIYNQTPFHIVTPSHWLKDKVSQTMLATKPVSVIYNGVDTSVFRPIAQGEARNQLKLPQDKKIILFLAKGGKKNPWKGWQYFESVVEHFKDRKDILFLAIGGDDALQYPNVDTISYIANEQTLAAYYSAADVLLYPSIADNCPLVVLEAQACGLPVVAFNTGGIPELVEHEMTGYISSYKDTQALIQIIEKILNLLQNHSSTMRTASTTRVTQHFTLHHMTQQYINIYQEILATNTIFSKN